MATIKLPQPDEITEKEKDDALGAYLMMFAAWGAGLPLPLLNLIAAVIYFFVNKSKSRFVAYHSFQSLLTQIPISILNAGVIFWVIRSFIKKSKFTQEFFIFLIFVVVWNLVYVVLSLVACSRARKGRFYYMLFFGRIAFNRYYGPGAKEIEIKVKNVPPTGF